MMMTSNKRLPKTAQPKHITMRSNDETAYLPVHKEVQIDDRTRIKPRMQNRVSAHFDDRTHINDRTLLRDVPASPPQYARSSAAGTIATKPHSESFQTSYMTLSDSLNTIILGKENAVRLCIAAAIASGHILLEDVPGTGKTQLASTLAASLSLSFARIQFTPDMLPSDILGTTIYNQHDGTFRFRPGPIFASIILADEINRASPKTQSALLEAMEEGSVTIDGIRRPLPKPFLVIATQNPTDHVGTYPLPDAQLDRFLIRVALGPPDHDASLRLLGRANATPKATPILSADEFAALHDYAQHVYVSDAINEYVVRIVEQTRHTESVACGSSIRGALALIRCSRVWAAQDCREFVIPDDIRDIAVPVLAHRIRMTPESNMADVTAADAITDVVNAVPLPEAGVS